MPEHMQFEDERQQTGMYSHTPGYYLNYNAGEQKIRDPSSSSTARQQLILGIVSILAFVFFATLTFIFIVPAFSGPAGLLTWVIWLVSLLIVSGTIIFVNYNYKRRN